MREKNWLVVFAILKNISQWEGLSHISWNIKNVPNHQPESHPFPRLPCQVIQVDSPGTAFFLGQIASDRHRHGTSFQEAVGGRYDRHRNVKWVSLDFAKI